MSKSVALVREMAMTGENWCFLVKNVTSNERSCLLILYAAWLSQIMEATGDEKGKSSETGDEGKKEEMKEHESHMLGSG